MEPYQIASALVVVLMGGVLQGTVAFGFGLFVVPLLLTVGFPVATVLAISAICTVILSAAGVHHLRHAVPWRPVWVSLAIRGASMFLGIWALRRLAGYPVVSLKFWVGAIMLSLVVVQAFWQPRPRASLHPAWSAAAFLASGFTGGLCSMGGPPLVLWVMAHDWPPDRTRAFLFAAFMSLVPLQLGLLYWTFGNDVLRGAALGAALSPASWMGAMLGLRIGARFSKPALRRLAYLVLLAIALSAMSPQVMGWLGKSANGKGASHAVRPADRE